MDAFDAYTLAINVLRDSAEEGRMPSGLRLTPDLMALHADAAWQLEQIRREHQVQAETCAPSEPQTEAFPPSPLEEPQP